MYIRTHTHTRTQTHTHIYIYIIHLRPKFADVVSSHQHSGYLLAILKLETPDTWAMAGPIPNCPEMGSTLLRGIRGLPSAIENLPCKQNRFRNHVILYLDKFYPLAIKRGNWTSTRNGSFNKKISYFHSVSSIVPEHGCTDLA